MTQNDKTSSTAGFRGVNLLPALILAVSAWLHFRNLENVTYLTGDESRAFTFSGGTCPLIYFLGHPTYLFFGHRQSAVFYLAAGFGWMSAVLLYFLVKAIFGKKKAILTLAFYSVFPLEINYARTLLPAVFVNFCFMALAICFLLSLKTRKTVPAILAGFSASCMLFVHIFSGVILFGLCLASLVYFAQQKTGFKPACRLIINFTLGFLSGYVLIEAAVNRFLFKGFSFVREVFHFGVGTRDWVKTVEDPHGFLDLFSRTPLESVWGALILFIAVCSLLAVTRILMGKDPFQRFFVSTFLFAAGLFVLMTSLGMNTVYERHVVWLSAFYSLCCAVVIADAAEHLKTPGKCLAAFLAAGFMLLLASESYEITNQTFNIERIRQWLEAHRISRLSVVTSWYELDHMDDREHVSLIPGYFAPTGTKHREAAGAKTEWYFDFPKFEIAWPSVFRAYQLGKCKYLLTSGIDLRSTVGEGEELLKNVRPVMTWPHPYFAHEKRPYYKPYGYQNSSGQISLYDLADVFSRENLRIVRIKRYFQDKLAVAAGTV